MVEGEINRENSELHEHLRIMVDPGQMPIRIDKFILDKTSNISRNRIQNACKVGAVLVNDIAVKQNYKVRPNDVICVVLPQPPQIHEKLLGENIPLDIVYEDESVLVVNKPAGLVVHPGIGNYTGTLVNGLVYYFNSRDLPVMAGNQNDRPGLVHRIDKDTSGLLVIAKTELASNSRQFGARDFVA